MCAFDVQLCIFLGVNVFFGMVAADRESTNSKAVIDAPSEPQKDAVIAYHEQMHGNSVIVAILITGAVLVVAACVMVTWSIYRRLHSTRNPPEMIEMETMLHV